MLQTLDVLRQLPRRNELMGAIAFAALLPSERRELGMSIPTYLARELREQAGSPPVRLDVHDSFCPCSCCCGPPTPAYLASSGCGVAPTCCSGQWMQICSQSSMWAAQPSTIDPRV